MAVSDVLVLRALALGDLLTGVPALRALADAFPGHRRILAAPAALRPLVDVYGLADAVLPVGGLVRIDHLTDPPAVAVNLHGRGPQSHRVLLATRPGSLVAFAHDDVPASREGPTWREGEHEVHRWCRLLAESGIPADPGRLHLDPPPVAVPAWLAGTTVVHPGASSTARRWPVARWAAVARREADAGRTVVVTGTAVELAAAEAVARIAGLPDRAVLAGRTGVLELVAVVAAAGRVVCGDTGVAHVATAVGTPSVVLYGPVPPSEWGPPPDRPQHVALWAGRRGDPHADHVDPGLLAIGVADVTSALASLPRPAAAVVAG